jgi:hypothetical protein
MEGMMLLAQARQACLRVWAEGNLLVIRGPVAARHLALQILARKAVVMPLLPAWNESTAGRLLCDEVASLGRLCPPSWRPTEDEQAALRTAEAAIDAAFMAHDTAALRVALRDLRWASFRAWQRHNRTTLASVQRRGVQHQVLEVAMGMKPTEPMALLPSGPSAQRRYAAEKAP